MGINSIIYLSEVTIFLLVLAFVTIIYKVKKKEGLLKFLGIGSLIFILFLGITFLLERPEMELPKTGTIRIKIKEEIPKPKTTYHFHDVTEQVEIVGETKYEKIGEYEASFQVKTLIGTYIKKINITVVDTEAPKIVLNGEEKFKISYIKEYEEPGATAEDNNDGDLTEKIKISKEEIDETSFNIKYEVEDSSGNKAEKIRKVLVIDDVPPVITLNGSETLNLLLNAKYEEKGAKAQDEKDGNLTDKIEVEGNVDTSKVGTYKIKYKVSDASGNKAEKTRTVKVTKQSTETKSTVVANDGSNGPKGVIYLTFDDGPSTNITPKILDVLKEKGVKATFFILNYNSAGEQLVKREYAEGHTVAIHGYSHKYADIYKSVEIYMENITKLQEKIKNSIGYTATITRFPGGSSNKVSRYNPGIMTKLVKEVVDRGFKYFDWNVSSGDAGGAKTADDVYNNVIKGLSKSKQNVVLMHDFSGNTKTLNALPRIIDYGIANGYTFERITESTPMVTHKPNN